jgi:hypothetical protein
MWQYRRLLAHQARRDTVALDNHRASAVCIQVMRYDLAQGGRQRRRDADETGERFVRWSSPHIRRREKIMQRGLLLRSRDLLERQAHVVHQQERDAIVACERLREQCLSHSRRAAQ